MNDLIVSDYLNGTSISALSKKYGKARETIRSILIKGGITINKNPQKIVSSISNETILELYLNKNSTKQIQKISGLPKRQIGKILSSFGIDLSQNRHLKYITKEDLEYCYISEKMSILDIAKEYKTTHHAIKNLFKKFNIKQKSHSIIHKETVYPKILKKNKGKHFFSTHKKEVLAAKFNKYGTLNLQKHTSKAENEILEFVKHYTNAEQSNSKILEGKEIDIFLPELNIGIEYCGLRWHTEDRKEKSYHRNKFKKCQAKEIQLITIFEDEWRERKEQVKNYLLSKISKQSKIYARNCVVLPIDSSIASKFIEENHIQPLSKKHIKEAFGIFNNTVLLGVMTFGRHHRNLDSEVLNRMCFLSNVTVIGGASKLLKFANKNEIISWSDNRWSNGNVYSVLGFKKVREYREDYSYVFKKKPVERFPKQKFQKKKIGAGVGQTEYERAQELGYIRLWDCGKILWKYKKSGE